MQDGAHIRLEPSILDWQSDALLKKSSKVNTFSVFAKTNQTSVETVDIFNADVIRL